MVQMMLCSERHETIAYVTMFFSIRSRWAKEMSWGSDRIVNTQGVHQPIENKGDKFLLWRESGSSTPGFSVKFTRVHHLPTAKRDLRLG